MLLGLPQTHTTGETRCWVAGDEAQGRSAMASVGTASSVVEPPRIAEAGLAVGRERVWGSEQGSSGQRLTPGLVRGGASTSHWTGWSQTGEVG